MKKGDDVWHDDGQGPRQVVFDSKIDGSDSAVVLFHKKPLVVSCFALYADEHDCFLAAAIHCQSEAMELLEKSSSLFARAMKIKSEAEQSGI